MNEHITAHVALPGDEHITEHVHPHLEPLPFTEVEIDGFRAQDYKAAFAVCGLMFSIFLTGVVLYSIVLISVAI
jgi:hypothetical protein